MKRIIYILCVFFTLIISVNAGEMYICIDRDGNSIVTDSPQDGMKNCVLENSYKKSSPEEQANEKDNALVKEEETPKKSIRRINNCIKCCNNKIYSCYNYTADSRMCMAEQQNCVATCNSEGSSPSSWSDCWSQSGN
jgi:hypothetical protein